MLGSAIVDCGLTTIRISCAAISESRQIACLSRSEETMEFQKASDRFLQFCSVERLLSPHTISAYSFDLLDFRKWLSGGKSPEDVTEEDLRLYLEEMVATRGLSGATVRRRLACLRGFFRLQTEWEKIKDPFANWRPKLPRRKRLPRALARSELVSILGARAKTQRHEQDFQTALCLMIATGLRVGELCRIKLEDISPDCAVIRVHGKGSRDRVVYVTDDSLRTALAVIVTQRRHGACVHLLLNRLRAPMKPQSIRSRLNNIALQSGIQRRITPHMLRHTAATLLIETGVDIRFVQRLLGHSSIATTEIYTLVTDEALRSSLARADVLSNLKVA
jgi:integrase/recombinase XerD